MIILEYIIELKGLKKKEVAEIAGDYPQSLNNWLKQKRPIPKEKLLKLSEYFNIPVEYFEKEATIDNQHAVKNLMQKNERSLNPSIYSEVIPIILNDIDKLLRNDTNVDSLYNGEYTISERALEIFSDLTLLLKMYESEDVEKMFVIENFLKMLLLRDTSWETNVDEHNNEFWKDLFIVLKRHSVLD